MERDAEGFTAAAGDAADSRTYTTNHSLDQDARNERMAWLLARLGVQ